MKFQQCYWSSVVAQEHRLGVGVRASLDEVVRKFCLVGYFTLQFCHLEVNTKTVAGH